MFYVQIYPSSLSGLSGCHVMFDSSAISYKNNVVTVLIKTFEFLCAKKCLLIVAMTTALICSSHLCLDCFEVWLSKVFLCRHLNKVGLAKCKNEIKENKQYCHLN